MDQILLQYQKNIYGENFKVFLGIELKHQRVTDLEYIILGGPPDVKKFFLINFFIGV